MQWRDASAIGITLVVVGVLVAPIGYAMEEAWGMLWALGGAIAWVMIFALAFRDDPKKQKAWSLVGGWLCGTAWALGWPIARGLESVITRPDGTIVWGFFPSLVVGFFAGIGGGLLGGVAFGDRGRQVGTVLGLAWGALAAIAPFPFFSATHGLLLAGGWLLCGLTGSAIGLPFGLRLGRGVRPFVFVFEDLWPYLSEMAVPFGAFVCGFGALVLIFSGVFGTLWRLDPGGAFVNFPGEPAFSDFVYFSVAAATSGSTAMEASSNPAKLLVSIEAIFAQGWMIAVFAAVGAHLAPRFSRLADQRED